MSGKRRADKELTRDNWDDEDEPEDKGTFQKASEDILKTRVIKTARRRVTNGAADPERPSIFSGFTGFTGFPSRTENEKSSFSFVSNVKGGEAVDNVESDKKPAFAFSASSNFKLKDADKPSFSLSSNLSCIPNEPTFPLKCDKNPNKVDVTKKSDTSSNIDNQNKLNTLSNKLKAVSEEKIMQSTESKDDDSVKTPDEIFLQKLRSLNLLCTEWIIKHLNENLSYILTPIFDDYKKHLTQLREERQRANSTCKKSKIEPVETSISNNEKPKSETVFKLNSRDSSTIIDYSTSFSTPNTKETTTPAIFKFTPTSDKEQTGFKFPTLEKKEDPLKPFSVSTGSKFDGGLFKFNATSTNVSEPTNDKIEPVPSPFFSFKPNTTPITSSFFSQSTVPKAEENVENEDDAPPAIEDANIKEEGSVFDKKCKVFIKKDGNFVDHGVGFLFLKLVGDEQKCQVIVRANNKLANVIINVLLTSGIPVQKMGKNNVMIICCPTPETKQPTSVLLKVKTSDDAEELLANLNKYRK